MKAGVLTFGSVCSGVEAASLAWEPLGLRPLWFAEIEPFPAAVLAHHWPTVPNRGDMTALVAQILTGEIEAPDILVGGTPCQAFSVAGLRGSLDDERGNLTLVLVRLLDAIDFIRQRRGEPPCILVWENVPGVLSTKDNAFGCFLGGLAGEDIPLEPAGKRWTNAGAVYGYGRRIAWRIFDAQYFGVPQRRRRVFLVASAGGIDPAEILFERKSVCGHSEPGGEARESIAAVVGGGSHWDCGSNPHPTLSQSVSGGIIGYSNQEIFSQRGGGLVPHRMRGFGDYVADGAASTVKSRDCKDATDLIVVHGRQDPCASDRAFALDCQPSGNTNVVCINANVIDKSPQGRSGCEGIGISENGICYTLLAGDAHAVLCGLQVRRLTPLECERLQGMPDNHTRIPWRGKPAEKCPDGPRYKAVGNSMAVPVMRWIGRRLSAAVLPHCGQVGHE